MFNIIDILKNIFMYICVYLIKQYTKTYLLSICNKSNAYFQHAATQKSLQKFFKLINCDASIMHTNRIDL